MQIFTGFLFIAILVVSIKYLLYRRQIREICRQLKFLQQEETNKRLQADLSSRDIVSLINQINAILEEQELEKSAIRTQEEQLKETLANVSHDIRTPLTSLKGFFELYQQEEDKKQRDYYETVIRERMEDLTILLEELFTYTKLQNASYELVLEELNFTKIVMDSLFDFYEQWKEMHMTPDLDIMEIPVFVFCNDSAMRRILTNVLRNAAIHGQRSISVTYQTEDHQVVFRCSNLVTDTSAPDPEQVFDRFYRADSARSHPSNGLGLSIAMELTQRMNGTINATLDHNIFTIEIRFPLLSHPSLQPPRL